VLEAVDIHCHMLGKVDDGAKDIDEMKQMIDIAYADGTRHICFTPHFKIYHFKNEDSIKAYNERIDAAFAEAKE
jgi:protein-tyrosine phosphatase